LRRRARSRETLYEHLELGYAKAQDKRMSFALDGEPRTEKMKASAPALDPSGAVVVLAWAPGE